MVFHWIYSSCSLFKFPDNVHTVLQNRLPGRKHSQETRWEHNIVKCFTVLGEDKRASVACDLLCWSDMQVTPFTFLEPPWFTFPLQAVGMKLECFLLLSGSCARISSGGDDLMCCVSSSYCFHAFQTLHLVRLSGDVGFFSHSFD